MLVDITFRPFADDHQARYRALAEEHNAKNPDDLLPLELSHPPRMAKGMYVANGNFNVRDIVQTVVEDVPPYYELMRKDNWEGYHEARSAYKRKMNKLYSEKYKKGPYRGVEGLGAYGLCDSPEQFLECFPHIADDEIPRFLTFYGIKREHQSPQGGFRYHKNGTYYGKQKPRCEYLYDDTHIDMICGFHIYRVEDVISA